MDSKNMDSMYVFVKVDFLLQEGAFEMLRDFLSTASLDPNQFNYCSFELVEDAIVPVEHDKLYCPAMGNLIGQRLSSSYFLIQLSELKKIVHYH